MNVIVAFVIDPPDRFILKSFESIMLPSAKTKSLPSLTEKEVKTICDMYKSGVKQTVLAKMYGMSNSGISYQLECNGLKKKRVK